MWVTFFVIMVLGIIALCVISVSALNGPINRGETREEAVNHMWKAGYPFICIIWALLLFIASSFRAPFLIWLLVIAEIFGICWSVPLTTGFYLQGKHWKGREKITNTAGWIAGYVVQVIMPPLAIWPAYVDKSSQRREVREKQEELESKELKIYEEKKKSGLL